MAQIKTGGVILKHECIMTVTSSLRGSYGNNNNGTNVGMPRCAEHVSPLLGRQPVKEKEVTEARSTRRPAHVCSPPNWRICQPDPRQSRRRNNAANTADSVAGEGATVGAVQVISLIKAWLGKEMTAAVKTLAKSGHDIFTGVRNVTRFRVDNREKGEVRLTPRDGSAVARTCPRKRSEA